MRSRRWSWKRTKMLLRRSDWPVWHQAVLGVCAAAHHGAVATWWFHCAHCGSRLAARPPHLTRPSTRKPCMQRQPCSAGRRRLRTCTDVPITTTHPAQAGLLFFNTRARHDNILRLAHNRFAGAHTAHHVTPCPVQSSQASMQAAPWRQMSTAHLGILDNDWATTTHEHDS
jgi:hypothetical protein